MISEKKSTSSSTCDFSFKADENHDYTNVAHEGLKLCNECEMNEGRFL